MNVTEHHLPSANASITSGWMNKQIAAKLGITEITVKVHRGNMMREMGADSFLDLVKIATRLPLMPVTKAETAAARPLNTRIAVRSGSRRTSAHAVAPAGLYVPHMVTGRLTTMRTVYMRPSVLHAAS